MLPILMYQLTVNLFLYGQTESRWLNNNVWRIEKQKSEYEPVNELLFLHETSDMATMIWMKSFRPVSFNFT